jgi:hypothetical protein
LSFRFNDYGEKETNMTFDHEDGRTKSKRNDALFRPNGDWMNACLTAGCNSERGSKRTPYAEHARFTREAAGSVGESE